MPDTPVDSHAHVWDRHCSFVPDARYRPDYEAGIDAFLRLLDAHGIARAVLVQPSFLGTDNSYLLAALRAHPDRLRGIVVLDPTVSGAELDDAVACGAVGLRYNLLSLDPAALAHPPHRALTGRAEKRGLWIEVQANGPDWPAVLDSLGDVSLMADHFGRPSGPDCPGLHRLLARRPERTVVKFSAPYRQTANDIAPIARALMRRFGPDRCLWGSDWPWTQHEGHHRYADTLAWYLGWAGHPPRGHAPLLGF